MTPTEITQQALKKWVKAGKALTPITMATNVRKERLEQVLKGKAVISLRGADKVVNYIKENL